MSLTLGELLCATERKEMAGVDWEDAVLRFCRNGGYRKLRNNEDDKL